MAYTFSASEADGVLTVQVGGQRPALDADAMEQMWGIWPQIADHCRESGIRRMVAVVTASGPVSSSGAASFYTHLGDVGLDAGMRIAVVIPDTQSRRIVELGAALAIEMGWKIRIFPAEEPAREWVMLD